jgi:hypothetical protein
VTIVHACPRSLSREHAPGNGAVLCNRAHMARNAAASWSFSVNISVQVLQ